MLCNVITAPPEGAAPFKVTVPVEVCPPTSVAGFNPSDAKTAAFTFKVALFVTPEVPEITAELFEPTGVVVTTKVALVTPAATVTLGGTWAALVLLLARVTTAPPLGAAALSVTVAVELLPPTTVVGLRASEERGEETGVTVSCAVCVAPYVPEIVTTVELDTELVVTANVPLVAPAATVMVAGTWAAPVLLLDRFITAPPDGAAPERVTVPVELFPPTREFGLKLTDASEEVETP